MSIAGTPSFLTDLSALRWDKNLTFRVPNGVNAIRPGQLFKFVNGVPTLAAATDKQLQFYVCLENADASTNTQDTNFPGFLAVPFDDCYLSMCYTGGTPVVGYAYGISDQNTVNVGDTTNLAVRVLEVYSATGICTCAMYKLSS